MSNRLLSEGVFDFVYDMFDHVDNVMESGKEEYFKKELEKIGKKYNTGVAADLTKYIDSKKSAIKSVEEKAKSKKANEEYADVLRAMGNTESKIRKIMKGM